MKTRPFAAVASFAALGCLGILLARVAAREASADAARSATMLTARDLFAHLQPCEVKGLREKVLARDATTVAFAGEFTPTRDVPWTSGRTRILLYIMSGHGTVDAGSLHANAGPGDFFVIPKGTRHAVRATSGAMRAVYFEDRAS